MLLLLGLATHYGESLVNFEFIHHLHIAECFDIIVCDNTEPTIEQAIQVYVHLVIGLCAVSKAVKGLYCLCLA